MNPYGRAVKGSFGRDILKFSERVEALSRQNLIALRRLILATLQKHSPVRTGAFRAAWKIYRRGSAWRGFRVFNPLPYANRLEHGWSKQAPNGIMEPSLREIRSKLRRKQFD